MKGRRLVAAVAAMFMLLAITPAGAASDAAGIWAIRSGGRTLALMTLRHDVALPGGGWSADLLRPVGTAFTQSHMAFGMSAVPEHRRLRSIGVAGGAIELKYVDPKPDQANDVIVLTALGQGLATWSLKGAPIEPLLLVRARPGEKLDFPWDRGREYALDEPWPSNPEMTRLFDEDQGARKDGLHIDWSVVGPQDRARREAARRLLDAGALRSGEDFWHAAFVFQHGDKPQDYLLAHNLAVIAAAKGRRDAPWIAAASLDRYLQAIGQKQVYGTQFMMRPGQPATQEPYDRNAISDAMRMATGVPPQAEQEKRRAEFDRESAAPAPPRP
ncbi:MAG: hypothetical protein JWO81_445 [Alphaproteobacteria bacterium]|nr:hypothetical protein [Alphaproteobacteria bacterium]